MPNMLCLPVDSALKYKPRMVHMPPQATRVCDISAGCATLLLGAY